MRRLRFLSTGTSYLQPTRMQKNWMPALKYPIPLLQAVLFFISILGLAGPLSAEPPHSSVAMPTDAATLAEFTGAYRYLDSGTPCYLNFYLGEPQSDFSLVYQAPHDGEDGAMFVEGPRSPRTRLRYLEKDTLLLPGTDVEYQLQRDSHGKVIGLTRDDAAIVKAAEEVTVPGQLCNRETILRHAAKVDAIPKHYSFPDYVRSEFMVAMRDGVKLHLVLLQPAIHPATALPILLLRTPYGVESWDSDGLNARYTELAASGYIFAFEDIRGRYGSGGQFVMNRAVVHKIGDHTDATRVDESTDAYDTVEWLVHNTTNNGRVGVMGVSYDGFTAIMAGIDPHPAVKAISPQAPMTNTWIGDDFFHNGAFRQTYGFDYGMGMESSKKNAFQKLKQDGYESFLHAGNFSTAAKNAGIENLPTVKEFLEHPEYAPVWQGKAVEPHLTAEAMPTILPTLEVGGWWDQEDMWGPQAEYAALKSHDSQHNVFLVLGPWRHGGWSGSTQTLGQIDFGEKTTDEFRAEFEAPFFAHFLKDASGFDLKDTASFQTGYNRWMRYDIWPPKQGIARTKLYLTTDGSLQFGTANFSQAAGGKNNYREFVSDPANPVPYRHRPIQATYTGGSQWYAWMVEDQRFATSRPDVLTWTSGPLNHDETVAGDVLADIYAATSGSDADWVVKLIDVYPDEDEGGHPIVGPMAGYQLMVNAEIFRARYRKSFEKPEPVIPNAVNEYRWSLHGTDHIFLRGHRIMVQVQSSWFPLYDRNPQTFVTNIMTAKPGDYKKATERIYFSPQYPSNIEVPLAEP